jgi:glutaredoxin
VKEYLSKKNITYTEYDVSKDREKAKEMVAKTKQMGVPVITIDNEIVIGFNEPQLNKLLA